MKYIIISDVHANLEALEAVILSFAKDADVAGIFGAGDIVGYSADPEACVKRLAALGVKNVLGNHDAVLVAKDDPSRFNNNARKAVEWTDLVIDDASRGYIAGLPYTLAESNFIVAHGTLHEPEKFLYMSTGLDATRTFEIMTTDICFVGHSHKPGVFMLKNGDITCIPAGTFTLLDNAKYIVNAGSIGQPRDGDSRASYCVYDTDKKEVQFRRIEYNIKRAAEKMIAAGLPRELADRLSAGV